MIGANKAESVLLALIDVIVDRLADILEHAGGEIETISHAIFDQDRSERPLASGDFKEVLRALGRKQQVAYAFAGERADRAADHIAAPVFGRETFALQLLLHAIRI